MNKSPLLNNNDLVGQMKDIDDKNMLDVEAKSRIFMITVSLDQIITDNESAYLGVLNSIISIYNSDLIRDDDFICFNIGSPIICRILQCDN